LYNLPAFAEQLTTDGYQLVFGPSCEDIFAAYERWCEPVKVQGYDLYGFQQFSLRRAYEQSYWFFNWATGAGKSLVQAVAAKDLFDHGEIDVVIACTTTRSKINQARFYEAAGLDVVVNDGLKDKRARVYRKRHRVYVMNYEKLKFDYTEIERLCAGRRVLFVFDEVTKIVTADKPNKARQAFERLFPRTEEGSMVWPMSASVVDGNPLRFRNVFSIGQPLNPLGNKDAFARRYADKIETIDLKTANGKTFPLTTYDWNLTRLQEIRHRVGGYTQTARKTDPGIAHLFKELATLTEPIQMEPGQRRITEAIITAAREAYDRGETLKPYYDLLRYTCNTALALRHTSHALGPALAKEFDLDKIANAKLERLNEQLTEIRDEGDQVLVFTHWTNLTLHLIKDQIEVPHVVHFGTGQSAKESQEAQDRFKATPDITCFFTSDAGMLGLNMQNARVVIQYDPTYSPDDTYQRASRIHRADSYLDGLINYVYVTDDSVEERVWQTNHLRRLTNEAVQGTQETLNFGEFTWADRERALRSEADNLRWLIFGED
jgi:superfamily II DNA or RNA helicase